MYVGVLQISLNFGLSFFFFFFGERILDILGESMVIHFNLHEDKDHIPAVIISKFDVHSFTFFGKKFDLHC